MSSYISVNYGAIYPLLKRLEERGEISVMAQVAGDGGNPRKIYDITAQGRELWREQMLEHPQETCNYHKPILTAILPVLSRDNLVI